MDLHHSQTIQNVKEHFQRDPEVLRWLARAYLAAGEQQRLLSWLPAQLAQRGAVEGTCLHARRTEHPQPLSQLARRARGEGDGEHLGRRVDPGHDAVGDPVRDRPGLARAGTGQHPDRPPEGDGDLPLLRVERLEKPVRRAPERPEGWHCGWVHRDHAEQSP